MTTSTGPHRGRAYTGAEITVQFEATRCRHFAECIRGLPAVFNPSARPWIAVDAALAQEVAAVVARCPSGALQYTSDTLDAERPQVPTLIVAEATGLLRVRGEIAWRDGTDVTTETRLALCGCGDSARRPLCDASCEAAKQ